MSPEAIAKETLDPRSDVYGLGVVLYELTCGRRLYKGATPAETRARATAAEVPAPTKHDEYYPPSLEEVVFAALTRDREARYRDAMALGDALKDVARKLGVDTGPDACARYLRELYGEDIGRRRGELHELAQAADPRRGERDPTVPVLQEAAGSVELLQPDHPATPTPSPAPELPTGPVLAAPPEPSSPSDLQERAEQEDQAEAPAAELVGPTHSVPTGFELPPGANDADEEDWDAALAAPLSAQRRWTLLVAALGLTLAVGAFFAGRFAEERSASHRGGVLHIESNPPGARVYDGSRLLGMTPFETPPAPRGKVFRLRVQRPGYRTWSGTVSVLPNRPYRSLMVSLVKMP